jgi:hypothetical protein
VERLVFGYDIIITIIIPHVTPATPVTNTH